MKSTKRPRSLRYKRIGVTEGPGSQSSVQVSKVSAVTGDRGAKAPEDQADAVRTANITDMLKDLTTREAGLLSILMPKGSPKMKGIAIFKLYCKYMPIELSRTSVYVMLARLVKMGLVERDESTGVKTYNITRLGRETFGYYTKSQILVVGAHVSLDTLKALVRQREKGTEVSARAGE